MRFHQLNLLVAYLLAGLSFFALSLGGELDPTVAILAAVAALGSLAIDERQMRSPIWTRIWTGGIVALFVLQVARGIVGEPILPLGLEFLTALLVARLYNRPTATEYQQIAALGLLTLVAATVLSTELSYAFAFLGFVIVTPWVLALGHLRAEIESHYGPQPGDEDPDEADDRLRRVLRSKRVIGPRYLLSIGALALPLFLMTGIVFVAFPRVGFGFLTFGMGPGQRVTGFGSNVELGDFGTIRSDPTVVLRVTPPNLPDRPPTQVALRLRGTSFDVYDGRQWTRSRVRRERTRIRTAGAFYSVPVRMPDIQRDEPWQVVMDHLEEPVLFLPPRTVGLQVPPRMETGFELSREIHLNPGLDVRYHDADGLGLRYTAWVNDDPADHPREELTEEVRARHLEVPPGHERVARLAAQWTEGAETDRERIARLIANLNAPPFTYSLDLPRVGDRVPLDVFLFEARRGHCEYYSTALAIMLRTQGIPSRNVTGFLGGRWNQFGRYYSLAQGDAHSWVEAYVDGRWEMLDPTPGGRDAMGPLAGLFGFVREMLDAASIRWSTSVVGYDLRTQRTLARRANRWIGWLLSGGNVARVQDPERPQRGSGASGSPLSARSILYAVLALALLAFAWWWWRRRGGSDGSAAMDPAAVEAVRLYRALEKVLTRLGHPRPPSRTPAEHADALLATGFPEAELVRRITDRYMTARYGGDPFASGEAAALRRQLSTLPTRPSTPTPADDAPRTSVHPDPAAAS